MGADVIIIGNPAVAGGVVRVSCIANEGRGDVELSLHRGSGKQGGREERKVSDFNFCRLEAWVSRKRTLKKQKFQGAGDRRKIKVFWALKKMPRTNEHSARNLRVNGAWSPCAIAS